MIQTVDREILALISWPVIAWVLRVLVGGTFLLAGFTKLPRRRNFEHIVLSFEVLPREIARVYAIILPWIEVVIGLALLFDIFSLPMAVFAAAMTTSFTLAVITNILRGKRKMDCGCFGVGKQSIAWKVIGRNVLLLFATASFAAYAAKSTSLLVDIHHQALLMLLAAFLPASGIISLIALAIALISVVKFLLYFFPRHAGD